MAAKKEINLDEDIEGEPSSLVTVQIRSLGHDDVTDDDRETWITELTKYFYVIVRKICPEDRDILVEVTLNEKGNAEHLRN